MNDPTPIIVTAREQAFLNRVRRTVEDVRRAARQLQSAATSIFDGLDKAEPYRMGLSQQTPKDLWDSQAKLVTLIELAPALLSENVRAKVLQQVISDDRMEIVYILTEVPPDA